MAGLKTIWTLISLLLFLVGCVPQAKQTDCGATEAFNATLRTCVPVMNGPSSFIKVDSFYPLTTLTKYKNDSDTVTLTVEISNPYSENYSVTWERIFNGVSSTLNAVTSDDISYYSFSPSSLSSSLGNHIFAVTIKDSSNVVVDTHRFEIIINDSPKPIMLSGTFSPSSYDVTLNPTAGSPSQIFRFTISNNGSTISGAGYKTEWRLYRSGNLIDTENDVFVTTSSNGFNYPQYSFSPTTEGIGNYIINARITNNASEVVAEKQWAVIVAHPALPKITNRDIYTSSSTPAYSTSSIAYNGVAYTDSVTYNFIPSTVSTPAASAQGDYCVTVADGTGTYSGDNDYVRVDYYLDGSTLVYSGTTTTNFGKVCLSDASPAEKASIAFTNATTTTSQSHTLVARVFDEYTGQEYSTADMNSGLGTYPVTWNFNVKPQNAAPTISFGDMDGITCGSSSTTAKDDCVASSDTDLTVTIHLSSDDFYSLPLDEANFDYSIRLYENNVLVQTCTKTDPDFNGNTDVDGSDGYSCVFRVNSYKATGPFDVTSTEYDIQAEIIDNGSPILGTASRSSTITWDFEQDGITEKNTAPVLTDFSITGDLEEGKDLDFSLKVTDAERDHYNYEIFFCKESDCSTQETLTSGTITRSNDTALNILSVSHTLPEDFLLEEILDCEDTKRNQACAVSFKITVSDVPNDADPELVSTSLLTKNIININPAPEFNLANLSPEPVPVPADADELLPVLVGFPLSFENDPNTVLTDDSAIASEKSFRYQWFVKNATSVTAWTEIEGANTQNLIWTPSLLEQENIASDNPIQVMLCVEDQPEEAVSDVNIVDSTCISAAPLSSSWSITVLNNLAVIHDLTAETVATQLAETDSEDGKETAIWYDQPSTHNGIISSAVYVAMIGNDNRIYVKKNLVKDREGIDSLGQEYLTSFDALPGGSVDIVKDLSITGNGSELYIAYLTSENNGAAFYPQVRRIDLSVNNKVKSGTNVDHTGKLGFDYDGLGFTNACNPATDCNDTATSGVDEITFSPSGANITGSFTLNTPRGDFTIDFGTYDGVDTICSNCSGSAMASQLTEIINTSADYRLAGYAATQNGSDVEIHGSLANDYFDASSATGGRNADRLGKIFINAGKWNLPFIDNTLGGSHTDKISIYEGSTGAIIDLTATALTPSSYTGLSDLNAAIGFDNYFDGTDLWIALISKTGSAGKLYKISADLTTAESDSIFIGDALTDIQVAVSSTNVFVGVDVYGTTTKKKLGIYDLDGVTEDEFEIGDSDYIVSNTDTDEYLNSEDVSNFRIIAYGTEARIIASTKGNDPDSTYRLYMGRVKKDLSGDWKMSCGDCQPITSLSQGVSAHVKIASTPVRVEAGANFRLSSDGNTANEGIKDVAFISFGQLVDNDPGATEDIVCNPGLGVLNVEGEAINSTSVHGSDTSTNTGLYRSPLVKNE